MTKWEYKNLIIQDRDLINFLTFQLSEYGKRGWEMCGFTDYINEFGTVQYILTFKRKIED